MTSLSNQIASVALFLLFVLMAPRRRWSANVSAAFRRWLLGGIGARTEQTPPMKAAERLQGSHEEGGENAPRGGKAATA